LWQTQLTDAVGRLLLRPAQAWMVLTCSARRAFHELPSVLMTPHVSGRTEGMLEARAQLIAENIHRVARGEPPVHLIPGSWV
jgi:phosphoglycerate dehydrogenase-like enzyme